tara:strand:- start:2537 stop:3007 length:471 start_codon:yes stop_codon:yes gene_type:complete
MTIDQAIQKTNIDIRDLLNKYIAKKSGNILGSVKLRFWQKGIDGFGNSLGKYAPSTVIRKKRSPFSRTSHVTLRNTGQWYQSLFIKLESDALLLDSKDSSLTAMLIDGEGSHFLGYGEGILEFSNDEKILIQTYIDDFQKIIKKQIELDLDLDITL